eukprot:GILJ01007817.1.p1 GENE.GILJ01007817.1~~GILJ01007817.1.p1  ORF type:complete len:862 (-),score=71.89 GILJ01007817.1:172-2757(-)
MALDSEVAGLQADLKGQLSEIGFFKEQTKGTQQMLCVWGFGRYGRLGLGDERKHALPFPLRLHGNMISSSISSTSSSPSSARQSFDRDTSPSNGLRTVPSNSNTDPSCDEFGYVHVSCGENHTCVVTGNHRVLTFGKNLYGQLGHGDEQPCVIPRIVEALEGLDVIKTSCGAEHMISLTASGMVYTWGLGFRGQLGHGEYNSENLPKEVTFDTPIENVACGGLHTMAVSRDHRVFSWGYGGDFQLGHDDTYNIPVPREISALRNVGIYKIACGTTHSAAVSNDGKVWIWGTWGPGEEVAAHSPTPTLVKELIDANERCITVGCGETFTAVLTVKGEIWTWGSGTYGKLGLGDTASRDVPSLVTTLQTVGKVQQMECGWHHMVAVLNDGDDVYSWGSNQYGQLGLGPLIIFANTPRPVTALKGTGVKFVACGGYHTICINNKKPVCEETDDYPPSSPGTRSKALSLRPLSRESSGRRLSNTQGLPSSIFSALAANGNNGLHPAGTVTLPISSGSGSEQGSPTQPSIHNAELERLRAEVDRLRQEAHILKQEAQSPRVGLAKTVKQPEDDRKADGELDAELHKKGLEDPRRKIIDDYEVEYGELTFVEEIGEGGYGKVFRTLWRGTTVAVKKLRFSQMDARLLADFLGELAVMKPLRHPNVVLFMGACTKNPNICIVTELCSRGSLWDVLHKKSLPLSWEIRLKMARDAARGMTYLHLFKPVPILHRDLKSLNLLVTDDFTVKVCDFGWARLKSCTMTGHIGTFQWMAPEVIANQNYTEKADVFSFGVVLWEMVTREPPYQGKLPVQVATAVLNKGLRPRIPGTCPKPIADLIKDCWDQDPDRRPVFTTVLRRLEDMVIQPGT